jgi:hypothetical protein
MSPVVEPEVIVLREVADRLRESGALGPTPLATIRARARRRRARRRIGTGLGLVMGGALAAGLGVARPEPAERVMLGSEPGTSATTSSTEAPDPAPSSTDRRPPSPVPGFLMDVGVFMDAEATPEQTDAVRAKLLSLPGIDHAWESRIGGRIIFHLGVGADPGRRAAVIGRLRGLPGLAFAVPVGDSAREVPFPATRLR